MRFLKILQKMWLVAMVLLLVFSIVRFFQTGMDNRMIAPLIGSILCFFVYWNLSNMIRYKELNQKNK